MSLLTDLEKIPKSSLSIYLILAALLSPGILFIYVFIPDLFNKLDIWRLLFLSMSSITPVLLFNIILSMANPFNKKGIHDEKDEQGWFFAMLILGVIVTAVFIYLVVFFRLFLKFNIKIAIISILILEFIHFIAFLTDWIPDKIKKLSQQLKQ